MALMSRGLTVLIGTAAAVVALATPALATPSSTSHGATVGKHEAERVCASAKAKDQASCFALKRTDVVEPSGLTANSVNPYATPSGYGPSDLRSAYALTATGSASQTVAIVDDATAYGQGLAVEFERRAKADGIKVMSHDATNDKATDFRAILTKIKGEQPDAVMYGGLDSTGGPFAKQAKQLGMSQRILAGDGLCADDLAQLAGDAADDVICSIAGAPLAKMPKGPAFAARYEKRFGARPVLNSPFAYDAVYVIVDAMKRAGSTAPDKILAAMPATNYQGVLGQMQFDSKGDLLHGTISLYKYIGGKQTLLDYVKN